MKITVIATANFTASCGAITAGEIVAVVTTDRKLETDRDLLSLVRTGADFTLDESKLEVGELQSLLRTRDKVHCDSDDEGFNKPEPTEDGSPEPQGDAANDGPDRTSPNTKKKKAGPKT